MAVRTKELCNGALNGQTAVTLATVPAGTTWIVKDVAVYSSSGTITARLQIVRGAVTAPVWSGAITAAVPVARGTTFIVLEPGDVLQVVCNATPAVGHVWISGSALDGVAT